VSYFLIFLAVIVAAVVAFYVVGLKKPAGPAIMADGLAEPVANLPPVMLPDDPEPADVDRIRFSLGLRGYRMEQVDEVLDLLRDRLAERDARIAGLEAALAAGDTAIAEEADGSPDETTDGPTDGTATNGTDA